MRRVSPGVKGLSKVKIVSIVVAFGGLVPPSQEVRMFKKLLPRNVHNVERVVRVLVGIGAVSLAFVGPQTPWGYLGLVAIATGLIGTCPLYTACGFGTCALDQEA
jgi:hypothetical protein